MTAAVTSAPWVVPLSDLVIDDELLEAATAAVSSGWWSMGPRVEQLEREFSAFTGSRHAFAVANGTAALHMALLACGCGPGDEVIVPSLNFVAAANTIARTGATPVFCDIAGDDDLNLDPADVEAAVGPQTRGVVALHYGGWACRLDELADVARRHGLWIVEDAAHAPGGRWRGRHCGTIGAVGCFSFFSNKNLPVGEGGMVVTDDDAIAEQLRLLRSHGMTTLTWDRHRGHASSYDVVLSGFNYRLDEIRAALGLVQLRRLPDANRARAAAVDAYREGLRRLEGVTMPFSPTADVEPAHHLAVAVLPAGVDRDAVRTALVGERVQTSVHYPPIHLFTAFAEAPRRPLPRTEAVAERLLTLPLFPSITWEQTELVLDALARALE